MGFLQPQTQTAQKTASSSGGFLQQSGQTLAPSKPTAKPIGKTTTPTPTKSPTQQVKGFISKASSKVPEEALIRKPIDIYKKIISTGLRVADKQLGVSKKVDTFQKVALKTGKVLQKAPDVNLGTFFKLKELPKTKVASKTLEPEDKIVNFISNFPSAVARQYGTDIELVSTKEGRNLLKRDAKNLPKTMSQVKTHIDNKEWQKAFEVAMSNTALVVALDAGGLIPTGLLAKGVTVLRGRKVAQEIVKEAVEQAEKEAVKELKVVSAKELGFKEPKPSVLNKELAQEVKKYQSGVGGKKFGLQRFLSDYAPTQREIKLTNLKEAVGSYNPITNKIEITKGIGSRGEIKEVIGHETRHSIDNKISEWLVSLPNLQYKKIVGKVDKFPITTGTRYPKKVYLEDNAELAQELLAEFTYENKLFKKEMPEVFNEISNYLKLRKQARSIPDLASFYKRITQQPSGAKPVVKTVEQKATPIVKPKEISVPRDQLPVSSKEGVEKVSRLEARITASLKNISEETKEALGQTKITGMTNKDQIRKASEYVINNTEEAMAVIKGEKPTPKGLLDNAIFVALHNLAKDDTGLARRIASLKSTRFGQEIEILKEIDPNSPVKIMSDLVRVREEAFKRRYKGKTPVDMQKRVVADIQKGVKVADKYDWNKFVESIKC